MNTPEAIEQAAKEAVEIVLGFNELDTLAELGPEHANRKYVVLCVADAITKHLAARSEKEKEQQ